MQNLPNKAKVAISIGDINGIGPEILLRAHHLISKYCEPIYCVHKELLDSASNLLAGNLNPLISSLHTCPPNASIPQITPGKITQESGKYSFESFTLACKLAEKKEVDFITTLPIHKHAWHLAGIPHIGHTEALREWYGEGIMMLGCEKMFVALFTDHIALKDVSMKITPHSYQDFLLRFFKYAKNLLKNEKVALLGINPHCGDNGLMGYEDDFIKDAIKEANKSLGKEIFLGPFSGDVAFSPKMREKFRFFIAPYHDIGLSALKALYFDESINITLGTKILRTSVDHGVAYDIAYTSTASLQSYENAILLGVKLKEGYAK